MPSEIDFKAIETASLIPAEWAKLTEGSINLFNMALIPTEEGYLAAYRFVSSIDQGRRIAICRITKDLEVVSGSALGFSDLVEFATNVPAQSKVWFADPRLFSLQGKTYMVWNNGHTDDDTNHQYMVELDSKTGKPAAKVREIILRSGRRKTEKNWAFFEAENQVWAVYSVTPHRILKVDLNTSKTDVLCDLDNVSSWKSSFSEVYGAMRGGAQPIQVGDKFINIVHSRYNMPEGAEYVAAVYEFSKTYPFQPVREKPYPLDLGFDPHSDPSEHGFVDDPGQNLNPTTSWVLYPTGFAVAGDRYVISGGYNDSHCFIASGTISHIETDMKAIRTSPQPKILPVGSIDGSTVTKEHRVETEQELPLFWWIAKDRLINGKIYRGMFKHGNFGDDASELIIKKLTPFTPVQPDPDQNKLLAIGSVLHRAIDGDVVWGSGLKGTDALDGHPGGNIFVRAVRGPMTLDVLNKAGWDTSNITELFDPGVLLVHLWKEELAKYNPEKNKAKGKIRILPHYRDEIVFKRWNPKLHHHFISADNHPLTVLKQMLGAELVISSSLHGIIFAESLGIPAIWIDSPGKEAHFKYVDYYASTGRTNVKALESIQDALKANPAEVPTFDFEKLLKTFPEKEIKELQTRSQGKYKGVLFTAPDFNTGNDTFAVNWSDSMVKANDAVWVKGLSGSFTLQPKKLDSKFASIKIMLKRCDTRLSPVAQTVTVTTSAGSQATVVWNKNDLRSKEISLPISGEALKEGLTVHLKAKTLGPQNNWLKPMPFASVGVVTLRSE